MIGEFGRPISRHDICLLNPGLACVRAVDELVLLSALQSVMPEPNHACTSHDPYGPLLCLAKFLSV